MVEGDDRVSGEQRHETGHENYEDRYVRPTSRREQGERVVLSRVHTGIRVVERIVEVWVFRIPEIGRNCRCVRREHGPFTCDRRLVGRGNAETGSCVGMVACDRGGVVLDSQTVRDIIEGLAK